VWCKAMDVSRAALVAEERLFHLHGQTVGFHQPLEQPFNFGKLITEEKSDGYNSKKVRVERCICKEMLRGLSLRDRTMRR